MARAAICATCSKSRGSEVALMRIWWTSELDSDALHAAASHAIGSAECLQRIDRKGSIILCEQGNAPKDVAETQATTLFTCGRFGPDAGAWIFVVGIWAPADWRAELCAWYRCEHGPMLVECPEWQGFQFLETTVDDGCQFYVLHRLADRRALESEQRKRSRATPWFRRLAKHDWFDGPFERILAHRVSLLRHAGEPQ